MKSAICSIFAFITIFYLVEYESYTWDPCQYDENGNGFCYAINCPLGGCPVDSKHFFVKSMEDVRELVDKNGTEHLSGMYRIEWDGKAVKMHELKLVPSFEIEDKNEDNGNWLIDSGTNVTDEFNSLREIGGQQ